MNHTTEINTFYSTREQARFEHLRILDTSNFEYANSLLAKHPNLEQFFAWGSPVKIDFIGADLPEDEKEYMFFISNNQNESIFHLVVKKVCIENKYWIFMAQRDQPIMLLQNALKKMREIEHELETLIESESDTESESDPIIEKPKYVETKKPICCDIM